LRHVNEVGASGELAKGSKVFSGVKATKADGTRRLFDLGDGVVVNIHPLSEADALYRAGGKVHIDEVKRTASALANKLRKKPGQLNNLKEWRSLGPDREVMIVVESEFKWTNLLGDPDVFEVLLLKHEIPLKIGGTVFDVSEMAAFHSKIVAKHRERVVLGGMTHRAFMELPQMATIESAAKFVGYP